MEHRASESPWKFMVKEIMKILPYFSTENLVKLTILAGKLAPDE